MPRRRPKTALAVSLFPFLSILACVMGILTLLIAALAVGEIASTPPPSTLSRAEPTPPISVWVDRIARNSASLSRALASRAAAKRLQSILDQFGLASDSTLEDLERQLDDRARLTALALAREADLTEIEEIRGSLRVMATEIRQMADFPSDTPIEILPAGTTDRLAPYFVEVLADGLRIRRRDGEWSQLLKLDDLHQRGLFKVFLENVRARGNATAIFLVRPSGVESFMQAKAMATRNFVRFGKLAVPGEGSIDFKAVDRPASGGGPT